MNRFVLPAACALALAISAWLALVLGDDTGRVDSESSTPSSGLDVQREELKLEAPKDGIEVEAGSRTEAYEPPENMDDPWFVDMSHVEMTGLSMFEYLEYWHSDYWDVLGPVLESDEFFDYVFEYEHDIGDPIKCLQVMPGLLLERFRTMSYGRKSLERHLNQVPGIRSAAKKTPRAALTALASNGQFNVLGRDLDSSSPEWEAAVEVVREEMSALKWQVTQFVDEVEVALAEDLQGLSPYQKPRYGSFMFGPYHTRQHPLSDNLAPHRPYCLSMYAGDNRGECKTFTGYYTLILERSPRLAPLVRDLKQYRQLLEERLKAVVLTIPALE